MYNLYAFLIFKEFFPHWTAQTSKVRAFSIWFIAGYQRRKMLIFMPVAQAQSLGLPLSPSHATFVGCESRWLCLQNISRFSLLSHFSCDLSWSEPLHPSPEYLFTSLVYVFCPVPYSLFPILARVLRLKVRTH